MPGFSAYRDISIRAKLFMTIILIVSLGVGMVAFNMYMSLENISEQKFEEVQERFKQDVLDELNRIQGISLSNAVALSHNGAIIRALQSGEREEVAGEIEKLIASYQRLAGLRDVKIHIHTADVKSFYRSWKRDEHGDDLSGFRHSVLHVKSHRTSLATMETGRAGVLIRGIAPVLADGKYLGSVEFIQDFSVFREAITKSCKLSSLLLTPEKEGIEFFYEQRRIGTMQLSHQNGEVNESLSAIARLVTPSKMGKENYITDGEHIITWLILRDFRSDELGTLLLIDKIKNVESVVKAARSSMKFQIIIMVLVGFSVMLLLLLVLKKLIANPLRKLVREIVDIKQSMTKDTNSIKNIRKLPIEYEDEVGAIARAFNLFTEKISLLYQDVEHSTKITDEYLKAVYAGGIVSRGDLKGRITYVNDALCEYTGYSREELIGKSHSIFRHPNTPKEVFRQMWSTIQKGDVWHGLFKNVRKDGSTFYANITLVPIKDEHDEIIEYLALRNDVTELVNSKKELKAMFQTDALTSLGNRFKLIDAIKRLLKPRLCIIDIRSFKEINDFYGPKNGDKLIVKLGTIMFEQFHDDTYSLYRLQGDTYGILADGRMVRKERFEHKIRSFIEMIQRDSVDIEGNEINLTLTAGIAYNKDELIIEAEVAHQTAKKENTSMVVYSDELKTSEEYRRNLLWTAKVKKALSEDKILTYFQPIYNNRTQEVDKFETLVRLDDEGEIVSPYFFLDISKRARLYPKITRTVIEKSFKVLNERTESFSVNLSAEDIVNPPLVEYIFETIDGMRIGTKVVFEIVESESIQSFDVMEEFIHQAKKRGCKIAIDDFGTGYSNFEYLIKMRTDYLKIDGSLIKHIDTDRNIYNVVETIVAFARKNGIQTIAEFVESEAIQKVVVELGIDYSQGYFFGKPESL